jgi:hypothetical protein
MIWPERPTCHDNVQLPAARDMEKVWRQPWAPGEWQHNLDRGHPCRSCWYCGSIPAEDLYNALIAGDVRDPEWADMKYGWPHKLYCKIRNPYAGQPMMVTGTYKDGGFTPGDPVPAPEFEHCKFYSEHILDITDENTQIEFCWRLHDLTGVMLAPAGDGRIKWGRTR